MPAFMELLPFIVDLGDNKELFKIPFEAIGENLGIICGALLVGMVFSYFKQGIYFIFNHFFTFRNGDESFEIHDSDWISVCHLLCCYFACKGKK